MDLKIHILINFSLIKVKEVLASMILEILLNTQMI